jgi:two-component system, OmpR family, sensor kinase
MIGRLGIRVRLVGGGVLIAVLVSIAAGLVVDRQIQRIVRDGTIAVLRSDAATYAAAIRNEPNEPFDKPGSGQSVAVVSPTGAVEISTLPHRLVVELPAILQDDESRDFTTASGRHYIVRAAYVKAADGTWRVVTARTAESEATIIAQMRGLLVSALIGVVVAVAAAAWVLTSASLIPVRRLRRTAEQLSSTPSRELLPVPRAADDIRALATTLNGLIEQLRDSAERERQLVSDASHELRTPLAILRAQLDVALRDPASLEALVTDLRGVDRSADRLARLLDSLLELSRIESGDGATGAAGAVLADEIADAAERGDLRIRDDAVVELRTDVDTTDAGARAVFAIGADELGRIVDNLLGNALRALGDGPGTVLVSCAIDADELVLTVADDGGGMAEDFVPHALDRFRRDDPARTADGGAGLGLSIVAALARRAGGDVQLLNRPGDGLTVRVRIPAERPPAD